MSFKGQICCRFFWHIGPVFRQILLYGEWTNQNCSRCCNISEHRGHDQSKLTVKYLC